MQPISGNQRTGLLTCLTHVPLARRPPRKMHLCRGAESIAPTTQNERPKVVRTCCASAILTSPCASRYNAVCFFNISTSKNALRPRCFEHFDLKLCFTHHSGVQFLISHLTRCLRTCRFREPTFRETGTSQRFNTMNPNHAWERFNHEKKCKFQTTIWLFRQHVY